MGQEAPRGRQEPAPAKAGFEWHPGELYPRFGFIVTNLSRPATRVLAFYNQRGTAEQQIKEGKNAIVWTRLSCTRFRNNEVRLQLHALAYNLANFMRTLALPDAVRHWSLTSLREKLVKIGTRIVGHGRYVTFQMAEVAVPRGLFDEILRHCSAPRSPSVRRRPSLMSMPQSDNGRGAPCQPELAPSKGEGGRFIGGSHPIEANIVPHGAQSCQGRPKSLPCC